MAVTAAFCRIVFIQKGESEPMKKTGIYLVVQSRITVCAIETLLPALNFIEGGLELAGASADLEVCVREIKRLQPRLILTDQEVCEGQDVCICRKLAESGIKSPVICLQSFSCRRKPAGAAIVQMERGDFDQDRLTETIRRCLNDRSKKDLETETSRALIAVKGDKKKQQKMILSQIEQDLKRQGGSLKALFRKQEVFYFLAEAKQRRTLMEVLEKISSLSGDKKTAQTIFYSIPFLPEDDNDSFPCLFEQEVKRRLFYEQNPLPGIDLKAAQCRSYAQIQPELFPADHFSRILEKGSFQQAAALIKWYIERAEKHQWNCDNLKYNMQEAGSRLLQCQNPDLTAGAVCKLQQKILGFSSIQELKALCREWADGLLSGMESGGIEEILQYIQCHYYEDLTLTGVAKLFNYNYYYLSSALLKQAGVPFTEYLNQVRISEACRLLETSELPISMVADMTGYGSSGYFSRIFKKYRNCSPSEYRKEVCRKNYRDDL